MAQKETEQWYRLKIDSALIPLVELHWVVGLASHIAITNA